MELGVFELNESAVREWLRGEETRRSASAAVSEWNGWDPLEIGAESTVIETIASVQRRRLLTGPADIGIIYVDDPDGDAYYVTVDLTSGDGENVARLASTACDWDMIAPSRQTGIEAVIEILVGLTAEANALLRRFERFTASHEQAAYDRGMADSLEVTDGIEAHATCGCSDPIALYDGAWTHVYNDRLRGTDDHDPAPA